MTISKVCVLVAAGLVGLGCSAQAERGDESVGVTSQAEIALNFGSTIVWGDQVVDTAATSKFTGELDVFEVEQNGTVTYWDMEEPSQGAGYQWFATILGKPSNSVNLKAAAVVNPAGFLDVFALGSDGKIYWRESSLTGAIPPVFGAWQTVANTGSVKSTSKLAVVEFLNCIHLFWVTSSGEIGHAWTNTSRQFVGSQDGSNTTWLHPVKAKAVGDLKATKIFFFNGQSSEQIHLFFVGGNFGLTHHWWDSITGGHHEELKMDGPGFASGQFDPSSFAAIPDGQSRLDLFTTVFPDAQSVQDPNLRCDVRSATLSNGVWQNASQAGFATFECLSDQSGRLVSPPGIVELWSANFHSFNNQSHAMIWGKASDGLRSVDFNFQ